MVVARAAGLDVRTPHRTRSPTPSKFHVSRSSSRTGSPRQHVDERGERLLARDDFRDDHEEALAVGRQVVGDPGLVGVGEQSGWYPELEGWRCANRHGHHPEVRGDIDNLAAVTTPAGVASAAIR